MNLNIKVVIKKDFPNGFYAECPDLPGCFSNGDNIEDCENNIRDAISLYLDALKELPEAQKNKIINKIIIDENKKIKINLNFNKDFNYA